MLKRRKGRVEDSHLDVDLGGRSVRVTVRRHPRAKRIIMRPDENGDGAIVTLPVHAHADDARDMVHRHATWLREKLSSAPSRLLFVDGGVVPYQGEDHTIKHVTGRRAVECKEGALWVSGAPEHLSCRLIDWLWTQVRCYIIVLVDEKAL